MNRYRLSPCPICGREPLVTDGGIVRNGWIIINCQDPVRDHHHHLLVSAQQRPGEPRRMMRRRCIAEWERVAA